jgi:hypothetical protein
MLGDWERERVAEGLSGSGIVAANATSAAGSAIVREVRRSPILKCKRKRIRLITRAERGAKVCPNLPNSVHTPTSKNMLCPQSMERRTKDWFQKI